jgi:cyclohexyl-isocyanide hydratase
MAIFPGLTQLDLTGPYEVLRRVPGAEVSLITATRDVVRSDTGLVLTPDETFAEAARVDVVFVPGGPGIDGAIRDGRVLDWLRRNAQARWITSVCTGALILGAAGLLRGYRATTHWLSVDLLPLVGAEPSDDRVVVDRNRVTGGGVTAGIDFALSLVAEMEGVDLAKRIQLFIQYDPAPPFDVGSPRKAPAGLVEEIRESRRAAQEARRALLSSP